MDNKPRILLVEDEPGIADTVQYVLNSDGFTPVWCSTAAEALRQFTLQPPALAILDVGLPDLNGFELFKRLQALPGGAKVPMLFLTARSDEIDRVVGLELGADDYTAKPFSPRELVARVRTILRRASQVNAARLRVGLLGHASVTREVLLEAGYHVRLGLAGGDADQVGAALVLHLALLKLLEAPREDGAGSLRDLAGEVSDAVDLGWV